MHATLSTVTALAMVGMLACSGCSQKTSGEEHPAHGKAAVASAKDRQQAAATASPHSARTGHVAQADKAAPPSAARSSCANCGEVVSVKEVELEGKASGVGIVTGGVAGGLLGNQVGQGSGRDVATVVGVVGGAIAGNTIEKKMKKSTVYDVTVRMEDGTERVLRQKSLPGVVAGDKVRVEGERVVRQ